jgi:hypothetical protein
VKRFSFFKDRWIFSESVWFYKELRELAKICTKNSSFVKFG